MAKMVNYGIAYGMSDFGLSSRAGIPQQEAREFMDDVFRAPTAASGTTCSISRIVAQARRASSPTLLGRRRFIPS